MKLNIYLKSGQTITLDHIASAETGRDSNTDEITSYSFKYEKGYVPAKSPKLLCLTPTQIVAITTENR
jgi:hypothetical protein